MNPAVFRKVALECGRIGLPVHIHVGVGSGAWFYNSGASPFLLESVINDAKLRGTNFVLIHGGLPFAEASKIGVASEALVAMFGDDARRYLRTIAMYNGEAWPGLASVVAAWG